MRAWRTAAVVAALSLSSAAACVRGSKPAPEEMPTFLRVENQALQDATVYVWESSSRLRLGRVGSLSTVTLRIPSSRIFGPTPLRFQLDFLAGGRTPLTEQITVIPGDTVVLQVPPQ
jgi:hypothetical protein